MCPVSGVRLASTDSDASCWHILTRQAVHVERNIEERSRKHR